MPPFGVVNEETELQRNGSRSSLVTRARANPDSISAVMTIAFVCGDPVDAIAYNTWSPIVLIRSTMATQRYVHDILQPHVLPLMQRLLEAIFQQDYPQSHTAKESQDYFNTGTGNIF
ncbi:transposable element Tcb2 transposase [Trichonephila clavipes]|nr:transposable element Tcb2 transposase [Trichonephila clavipes]